MAKQDVHVVPHPDGWAVKKEAAKRPESVHSMKEDALKQGREQVKRDRVELVIHGADRRIQDSDSYGNDPVPPRG